MKLEDRIDLGEQNMFWKKKKQDTVDESRREFIKNAPLGALGAYAAMRGFGSSEAMANTSTLPPGIADDFYSNDAIRWAWGNHLAWRSRGMRDNQFYEAIQSGLGTIRQRVVPHVLRPEEIHTKPAAHLVGAFSGVGFVGRSPLDSPMKEWNEVIYTFAHKFELVDFPRRRRVTNWDLKQRLEKPAIIGLSKAAGLSNPEEIWQQYDAGNQTVKTRIAQTMTSNLENKDKFTQGVAQWISWALVNSLIISEQNNINNTKRYEWEIINDIIEQPLRKITPRVRGPPYYSNQGLL